MRRLAGSLFTRRLRGSLKLIFMEGVVLQLLAEQTAAEGADHGRRKARDLSRRESAAIAEAHERLLADIRDPPSLIDLASAVGMSERALAGFRVRYGATPYEILRNERLEHARILLKTEDIPTKTIAFRVGYDHVSNFTRAFSCRFGAPPRRYLRKRPG